MKPKDVLRDLAEHACVMKTASNLKPKVGETVMKLSQKEREILSELKSSDIQRIRWMY